MGLSFDKDEGKALVRSKVFWGQIILLFSVFFPKLKPFASDEYLTTIGGSLGALITLFGRYAADQQITGLFSGKKR